jgi:hypothetical protein
MQPKLEDFRRRSTRSRNLAVIASTSDVDSNLVIGNKAIGGGTIQINGKDATVICTSSWTQRRRSAEACIEDTASELPKQKKVKRTSNASERIPLSGIRALTPKPILFEPFESFVTEFREAVVTINSAYKKVLKTYNSWHIIHAEELQGAKSKFIQIQTHIQQSSISFEIYSKHLLSLGTELSSSLQQNPAAEEATIAMCRKMCIALKVRFFTVTLLDSVVAEIFQRFLVRLPLHLPSSNCIVLRILM